MRSSPGVVHAGKRAVFRWLTVAAIVSTVSSAVSCRALASDVPSTTQQRTVQDGKHNVPNPEGVVQATCPADDTELGSYREVKAYSNGGDYIDTYWQCVEYVKRFYRDAMGVANAYSDWHGHAWEYYGSASSKGLDSYASGGTTAPRADDILCYDRNTAQLNYYGHVAIIKGVGSSSVDIIEQNWNCSSCYRTVAMTVSNGHYTVSGSTKYPILGWLRRHDTQPPSISWGGSSTGHWYSDAGLHVVTWSLSDTGSGVKGFGRAWDAVPGFQTSSSTGYLTLSGVAEGTHTANVHAWDNAGNDRNYPRGWYGWDVTPPSVNISAGPPIGVWQNSPQSVTWHITDSRSGVRGFGAAWDSVPPFQSSSADGALDLQEGTHILHVHAWDSTNNDRGDPGNNKDWTFGPYRLDTVAPDVTVIGPPIYRWFNRANGPQFVTWGATDATSGVASSKLTWDNGGEATVSPAQIPEGRRTATVTATDNAGNVAPQSLYGPWWVDTALPVPEVTFDPAVPDGENGWYVTEPTMIVNAHDPNGADASGVAEVYYGLDGQERGPFSPSELPVITAVTGDELHPWSARANDIAGNPGAIADVVKVDTTPPVFSSMDTDAESGSLSVLACSWDFDDRVSGVAEYEYSIYRKDPSGDELILGPRTTTDLWAYEQNLQLVPGQSYYFLVQAKNVAGLWTAHPERSDDILAVQHNYDQSPNHITGGVSVPEEARSSANYGIVDSLGQFVVDASASPGFVMEHGYWHSELVLPPPPPSIGAAKSIEDGNALQLASAEKPVVVTSGTSAFADRFYVEDLDRSGGVAVQYGVVGGPTLVEGDQVWLTGKMSTVDGERMLQFAWPTVVGHIDPLGPLFVTIPNIGGGALNALTPGVLDGIGLNNVGLLVKTYGGWVTYQDPQGRFFYLDDGSGLFDGEHYGVRVVCDGRVGGVKLEMPSIGKSVIVTGISSVVMTDNQPVRAIRPRRQSDIQVLN